MFLWPTKALPFPCLNAMKSGVQLNIHILNCRIVASLNAMKSGVQPILIMSSILSPPRLNAMKSGVQR